MSAHSSHTHYEPEAQRIKLLIQRDGEQAAREWIIRTLKIYREASYNPASHVSLAPYRPLFEESITAFGRYL